MPTRPVIVALVRGLLEAAVLAVIAAAIVWLSSTDLGTLAPYSVPAILVLRTLEGKADELIDPTRQRGPLGGAPAGPTAPHGVNAPGDEHG